LNETEKAAVYAELASGAETGWDYTVRWFSASKVNGSLVGLNVRNTIGVDLNSLHCELLIQKADLSEDMN
jgi:alpha,alpha-trehalase